MLGVVTLRGRDLVAPVVGVVAFGAFVITPGTVWAPQLIAQARCSLRDREPVRVQPPLHASGGRDRARHPAARGRIAGGTAPLVATAALGVALAATQLAPQSRQSWSLHQVPVALAVGVITAVGHGAAHARAARLLPAPRPRSGARSWSCAVVVVVDRGRMAAASGPTRATATPGSTSRIGPTSSRRRPHWLLRLRVLLSAVRDRLAEPRADDRSARARRRVAPGADLRGLARRARAGPHVQYVVVPDRAAGGRARHRPLALASRPPRRRTARRTAGIGLDENRSGAHDRLPNPSEGAVAYRIYWTGYA